MLSVLYIITKDSLSEIEIKKLTKAKQDNFLATKIYEIEEKIELNGDITIPIQESKINPLLRIIFENNFQKVKIVLKNTDKNPLHANNLYNIIKGSPYKGEIEIVYGYSLE